MSGRNESEWVAGMRRNTQAPAKDEAEEPHQAGENKGSGKTGTVIPFKKP